MMEEELARSLLNSLLTDSNSMIAVAANIPRDVQIALQTCEKGEAIFY